MTVNLARASYNGPLFFFFPSSSSQPRQIPTYTRLTLGQGPGHELGGFHPGAAGVVPNKLKNLQTNLLNALDRLSTA